MDKLLLLACAASFAIIGAAFASASPLEKDTFPTPDGDLTITFIGHASLMFSYSGKTIHVDPVTREGDYTVMPKADLILVTHEHGDHLDPEAITAISKDATKIVYTALCAEKLPGGVVIKTGDTQTVAGFAIEAVPAYNILHKRDGGQPFHPKGNGNGYIITFGDKRIYVAGDTENIPEMKNLKNIAIAFLPMNLPYTMTPEMCADAAKMFTPKVLYPYHYGATDTSKLVKLLEGSGIEVRIRTLK